MSVLVQNIFVMLLILFPFCGIIKIDSYVLGVVLYDNCIGRRKI